MRKSIKVENRRASGISHNQPYGFTEVKCNSTTFDTSDGLFENHGGKIKVQENMIANITASIEIGSGAGVYSAILQNGSYEKTLIRALAATGLGQYSSNQSEMLSLKKGDVISIGVGKGSAFSAAASTVYAAISCCCIALT